jgi:signal transduction histidine kinase
MGAPTVTARRLEARLRWRLAVLLAAPLGAIGLAAVLVTARALDAADDERARAVAVGVARSVAAEVAEGDAPDEAQREAATALDPQQTRVEIDDATSSAALPAALRGLPLGSCASADEGGAAWRACRVDTLGAKVTAAVRTDAHRAVVRRLAEWMAAAVALALVGALLGSRFALRGPLGALRAIADWAKAQSEGGAPGPAPRDGTVEIEHLAERFDALVGALVEALARARASSVHIAHELRTPLTAMIAELDGMPASDQTVRLRGDAERLARVIEAILVLSAPPPAPGDPPRRGSVIVNVADVARKLAPAGVEVEAPDEALVEAEPELVELAVHNLIENASKYAPGGARVVRVAREADRVRVGVVDQGPGVRDRARMFDRYWREAQGGEGRGLGLALVRAVAERSGGHADARAGAGGAGLDVGFSLGPVLGWSEV